MLQGSEILIILIIALVVLGPQRLPEVARKLGAWAAELRKAARDIRAGIEAEVGDLKAVSAELSEPIREVSRDLKRETREVTGEFSGAADEVRRLQWKGPRPTSGPTPEDALSDLDEIEKAEGDGDR